MTQGVEYSERSAGVSVGGGAVGGVGGSSGGVYAEVAKRPQERVSTKEYP